MAGNRFKNNNTGKDNPEQEPQGKTRKYSGMPVSSFLKDDRSHKVIGLFLILISAYLLIAFTSYLFTGRADHSEVVRGTAEYFFNQEIKVENWLGKFGAFVSHLFLYQWFGISSYVFVMLFFLTGFKFVFRTSLLPLGKTLLYSFFSLILVSVLSSFMVRNPELGFLGGAFGFHSNHWLEGLLGTIGTGFLLVFVILSFLVFVFNFSFRLNKNVAVEIHPDNGADTGVSEDTPINVIRVDNEDMDEENEESLPEELVVETAGTEELDPSVSNGSEFELSHGPELKLDIEESEVIAPELDDNGQIVTGPEGEYDPTLDLPSYKFPTLDLLEQYSNLKQTLSKEDIKAELEANKNRIVETLGHYSIGIDKIKATIGPTVTLFEIIPSAGIRISKIKNLEDDIALSLAALGIRIIAPIPGKGTIGIEVPNQKPEVVPMRSILASERFLNAEMDLPVALGKTISNEVFVTDLAKMPHLLMAGATGQGKSVGLNAVLVSLLYKKHPSQIKFVLVDPKKVELTLFKKIERHFLAKLPGEEEAIITDTKKVVNTLNSLCVEMDDRYNLLKEAGVRNIREYNTKFIARRLNPNKGHHFLPYIILVVDEFADLIMTAGKEIEMPIARLAQLARAIGIHLIIATQRPSVNIITGTIKANFPARIAFRVTSKIDSRTILDAGGADQLIGRGDMLLSTGADLTRLQCAFVDTPEVERITDFIGSQRGYPDAFLLPEYVDPSGGGSTELDSGDRDPLFEDAARIIVAHQQGSASLLQRRLKLGYNRAGRIIDQLEAAGIIGPFEGSKAREVRYKDETSLEQFLNGH